MGADYYESDKQRADLLSAGRNPIGIGDNCTISNTIVDKNARIGAGCTIVNKVRRAEAQPCGHVGAQLLHGSSADPLFGHRRLAVTSSFCRSHRCVFADCKHYLMIHVVVFRRAWRRLTARTRASTSGPAS